MKNIITLLLIIFAFLITNCSDNYDSGVSMVLINLSPETPNQTGSLSRAPSDMAELVLSVTGTDMSEIEETFALPQSSITVQVPSGFDRVFTLEVFDENNHIIYTGTSGSIELIPGELAEVAINMDYATWGKIYVANWGSNNVSIINGNTNTVVGTISVGTNPFGIGVNPNSNKVYVSNYTSNDVYVINSLTDTLITGTGYPISLAGDLRDVGINPVTNKIYVADEYTGDSIFVVDGVTDTESTVITAGGNYPYGIGVNPLTNKIYVGLWGATEISIINGTTDSEDYRITSGTDPFDVGVNKSTNKIYIANNGGDDVTVLDGTTDIEITTISLGVSTAPYGIEVNPFTNRIYVAEYGTGMLSVIDGATDTEITTISVGTNPVGVTVNYYTNRIYVANESSNNVTVIDGSNNSVITTIPVGTNPSMLDIMPY